MSLRTKMMLSIFVFMVLVLGLLTLNLWLDAARRAGNEAERNADLVARVVPDLFRAWTARYPAWTDEAWAELSRKLAHSELIEKWTLVRRLEGKPQPAIEVMISNDSNPELQVEGERALFEAAFDRTHVAPGGTRIYLPLYNAQGERFAARLDVRGSAVPGYGIADPLKGILTIMTIGTALLLLNITVLANRFVLRPLSALVEASNRVAGGDFTKKIPEGAGYDEMGRLVRAFNLMIDQVAQYHRTLQEDIRHARGKVQETERRLFAAQRLSTTGTLAAGIAHEINNPIGGMINAALVLREGKLEAAKREEYLELILDGLGRIRGIVEKILQFRPRPFEPRPVQVREAVEKAIAFLDHRARSKEIGIRNELPGDLPLVQGDPLELQQAFLNILMNAVHACVMGEGMVTVYHRLSGDRLSVCIADNGCGMSEEELSRCMDPFFTTKDPGEGTGLGLAVAHNIITNHGGKIDIESTRGRGTTVTLTLPILRQAAPVTAPTEVSG
jgi:signal transduction histidine kinase